MTEHPLIHVVTTSGLQFGRLADLERRLDDYTLILIDVLRDTSDAPYVLMIPFRRIKRIVKASTLVRVEDAIDQAEQ